MRLRCSPKAIPVRRRGSSKTSSSIGPRGVVGRWKTTKSYGVFSICISIATANPPSGGSRFPSPGGRLRERGKRASGSMAAARRPLSWASDLTRATARPPARRAERSREARRRPTGRRRLVEFGMNVRPRLFVFDPLARMKAPSRDESAQNEMASVIEFMRELRDRDGRRRRLRSSHRSSGRAHARDLRPRKRVGNASRTGRGTVSRPTSRSRGTTAKPNPATPSRIASPGTA